VSREEPTRLNRELVGPDAYDQLEKAPCVAGLARIITVAVACVVMSGLVAAGSVSGMSTSDYP
jgi:hypothetical protein